MNKKSTFETMFGGREIEETYVRVPKSLTKLFMELTQHEIGVILALLQCKRGAENPFPSQELIAESLGWPARKREGGHSECRWVASAIKRLHKRGLISIVKEGRSNAYDLNPLFDRLEAIEAGTYTVTALEPRGNKVEADPAPIAQVQANKVQPVEPPEAPSEAVTVSPAKVSTPEAKPAVEPSKAVTADPLDTEREAIEARLAAIQAQKVKAEEKPVSIVQVMDAYESLDPVVRATQNGVTVDNYIDKDLWLEFMGNPPEGVDLVGKIRSFGTDKQAAKKWVLAHLNAKRAEAKAELERMLTLAVASKPAELDPDDFLKNYKAKNRSAVALSLDSDPDVLMAQCLATKKVANA